MTENEITAAFAEMDNTHPFYTALLQKLDEAIVSEQDAVTVPGLGDAARHFNAGRLACAKDIRALIPDMTKQAVAHQRKMDHTRAAARE